MKHGGSFLYTFVNSPLQLRPVSLQLAQLGLHHGVPQWCSGGRPGGACHLGFASWEWCWNAALLSTQQAAVASKRIFWPGLVTTAFWLTKIPDFCFLCFKLILWCCKHTLSCPVLRWSYNHRMVSIGRDFKDHHAEPGVGCSDLFKKPRSPLEMPPGHQRSAVDSSWLVFLARLYFIACQIYLWLDFLFQGGIAAIAAVLVGFGVFLTWSKMPAAQSRRL